MRILLVEDDEKLNHSLKFQLEKENIQVDSCYDGEEALYYIDQKIHDMILLDWMLPMIDGIQVLEKMRKQNNTTPVILLTALGELDNKIKGLDSGADDYLVKPFAFEELMARIRCIFRRPRELNDADILSFQDIEYLLDENRLTTTMGSCTLSKKEGLLLETLLRCPKQTLSRSILFMKVWGMDSDVEDGNLDNYIHFLRRRLKSVGSTVSIRTIRGIGYQLSE